MHFVNIILIAIICTIVTDLTDFFPTIKKYIWKFTFGKNKPYKEYPLKLLDCSLCQTWWLSLIYLIIIHKVSLLTIAFTLFIAFLTPVISSIIVLVKDIFAKLLNIIYKYLIERQLKKSGCIFKNTEMEKNNILI